MADAPAKGTKVPVIADDGQIVEIHWRLKDGSVWIDRRACPAPAPQSATAATE